MARNENEVLLGPGYFYIAPATAVTPEAPPTFVVSMEIDTDPAGNWEDVGYSEDGWSLVGSSEFSFWTPAELPDPIATTKDSSEYSLRGVMAQFTLENLQIALAGGTITVDSAGVADTTPGLRHYDPPLTTAFSYFSALFITGKNDDNDTTSEPCVRMTYVPFVVSVAEVEIPHTKGSNPSLVGVELRAIKRSGSNIFRIDEQFEVSA
ncbi:hypothetical protein LCGC14_1326760 [marine sediment metagenome]|uniref:Major tail protein n=1 Tax=marine sediment metagenome TaxID=412755 RepID=A0A0F9NK74_9ZZZZ